MTIHYEDFDMGIEPLRLTVDPYYRKILFTPKFKKFRYTKYHVPVGIMEDGSPFMLDMREAFRMFICGAVRAGKTWFIRSLMDRVNKIGHFGCCFLTDIKDELKSSSDPVQQKFQRFLFPGEYPRATPNLIFRPIFFRDVRNYDALPSDNVWYAPKITDLNELDFMTLLQTKSMTDPQKLAMKEIYEGLKEYRDLPVIPFELFEDLVNNLKDFSDSQKSSLRTKFLPLKYSGLLDKEDYSIDFKEIFDANMIPALNLKGFDNIKRDGAGLPQVFVSIWIRKIIALRRARKISPMLVVMDEASRFIHKDMQSSTKLEVSESIDLDAREGVSWVIISQSPTKIDEEILNQCRYMLIPYNADINTMKYLFKLSGIVTWSPINFERNLSKIKKKMKKFQWVLIDRNMNNYIVIQSIAPLSNHSETVQ